jgi:hypothetical protein
LMQDCENGDNETEVPRDTEHRNLAAYTRSDCEFRRYDPRC